MMTKRKEFDEEFKKRAVQLSQSPKRTVQSVVDGLGISHSMLYRWRKKYSETGEKTEEAIQIEEVRRMRNHI